jgi:hypothetical protein
VAAVDTAFLTLGFHLSESYNPHKECRGAYGCARTTNFFKLITMNIKRIASILLWVTLLLFLILARIQVNALREQVGSLSDELLNDRVKMSKYIHGVEYLQLNNPKAADSLLHYLETE